MEADVNPYRAPAEMPATAERAATDAGQLEAIVESCSKGIVARRWGATLIDTGVVWAFLL